MKLVYCSAYISFLLYTLHLLHISYPHLKHTADKCTCLGMQETIYVLFHYTSLHSAKDKWTISVNVQNQIQKQGAWWILSLKEFWVLVLFMFSSLPAVNSDFNFGGHNVSIWDWAQTVSLNWLNLHITWPYKMDSLRWVYFLGLQGIVVPVRLAMETITKESGYCSIRLQVRGFMLIVSCLVLFDLKIMFRSTRRNPGIAVPYSIKCTIQALILMCE